MSKHTPGNWSATPEPNGLEWSVTADDWFVCCCADMPSEGMAEANARLIASAPDLLEALTELLIDMKIAQANMRSAARRDPLWEGCAEAIQPRVDAAIAAIAKATGNE